MSSKYKFELARSKKGVLDKGHVVLPDDPDTWVSVIYQSARDQNPLQFIVHYQEKDFGFTARRIFDQTSKPIKGIGTELISAGVKAFKIKGLTSPTISAEPRKFKDLEEQETVFELLEAAFSAIEPRISVLYAPLTISENLQQARNSGSLISDAY